MSPEVGATTPTSRGTRALHVLMGTVIMTSLTLVGAWMALSWLSVANEMPIDTGGVVVELFTVPDSPP